MRRFIYLVIAVSAIISFGHSHASAQVINGCIKGNGTLKIVADPSDCSSRETPISWLGELSSISGCPRFHTSTRLSPLLFSASFATPKTEKKGARR